MKNNESSNIIKRISKVKKILFALSGMMPFVLAIGLVIIIAIGEMWPIFFTTSYVGGETIYSNRDLPSELDGIEKWSDDERKFFDVLELENDYYNEDFTHYNAKKILKDTEEELSVEIPITTVSYQGTVDIGSFDEEYDDEYFEDLSFDTEYDGEKHVYSQETRDFYRQAGEKVGNTFMIYPGMRMLLGYLVGNSVDFYEQECEARECTSSTFSNWSLLGKITSSNENDASKYYKVSEAIEQIEKAIKYGEDKCDSSSSNWETQNICYDTDSLFEEIFGEKFSLDETSIIEYLQEEFVDATVPLESKIDEYGYYPAGTYINVTVKKSMDYELYEEYLKDIYIPYIYINCDSCRYRNESKELKSDETDRIYNEILGLISTFMYYNDEDYIDGTGGTSGVGGTDVITGVTYECGNNYASVSTDYCSTANCRAHNANDIAVAGSSNPNIYPLMEGEVVVVNDSCHSLCPASEANRYIAGASLSSLDASCSCGGGFGNYVRIKSTYNGKTIYATYAHLSSVSVSVGDKVSYETIIGVMGTTGVSTGRHLHIELSYNDDYSNKFPATLLFTEETVASTTCSRNISSEVKYEEN